MITLIVSTIVFITAISVCLTIAWKSYRDMDKQDTNTYDTVIVCVTTKEDVI